MNVIIGLGNVGKEYEDTRHNIGFMVVDRLAKDLHDGPVLWKADNKLKAQTITIGGVLFVKPTTHMNTSGEAVLSIMHYYKVDSKDLWIIHDDIDLPLGKIRIREKGASAGHNGIESVIQQLKTDEFVRFRLGIGRGNEDRSGNQQEPRHKRVIHFVLSKFSEREAGEMRKLVKHAAQAVRLSLLEGLDKAMNRYN
jgi:PTH1 family peptidyl-tRNA hydrolase